MRNAKKILAVVLVLSMILPIQANLVSAENTSLTGRVTEIQKYGNLTTDIAPELMYKSGFELGDMLTVEIGDEKLSIPFVTSYSDVDTGDLLVRHDGENNIIVVAINMGNFAKEYSIEKGQELKIYVKEKGAYKEQYLLHQLKRTNSRADYATDNIFANFRSISTTGINPGLIYRSSSPINNEISRAAYANDLAEAVGIKTVVNLADNKDEVAEYIKVDNFKSDFYYDLYKNDHVVLLDMGIDLKSPDLGEKMAKGIRFIIDNDGPYLVHCTEGKDRAGFFSAVIESLMGASLDEVKADYMTSFENYFNVEKGTEQYEAVEQSNIITSLTTIVCKEEKGTDISKFDLSKKAYDYLLSIGLKTKEIDALKGKLSDKATLPEPSIRGVVKEIEKYGHASLDIKIEDFNKLGFKYGDMVIVVCDNGFTIEAPYLDGYYVEKGYPLLRAYPGHETIAVCINYGKLFKLAGLEVGDKLTIALSEKDGYKTEYEIRKLERSNERADYDSDETFANYRMIKYGTIGEGVLYRSASPINTELNRAAIANGLMAADAVRTVINMADSKENVDEYILAEDFDSPYYKCLYDANKVTTLNMGLAYDSADFADGVKDGLIFMTENSGPYLIHCTEGKDRTGFMSALLEALMGASQDEIVEDYMASYANFYKIEKLGKKYNIIKEDVLAMLKSIAYTSELKDVDLAKAAEKYILDIGLEQEQIDVLKAKLTSLKGVPISVIVRKKAISYTDEFGYPFIDENYRTLVPLRTTLEQLGAEVTWDSENMTAIAKIKGKEIKVPIGADYILYGDVKIKNDTNSIVKNNRTYLPIRIVLESIGYEVSWDRATYSVIGEEVSK